MKAAGKRAWPDLSRQTLDCPHSLTHDGGKVLDVVWALERNDSSITNARLISRISLPGSQIVELELV